MSNTTKSYQTLIIFFLTVYQLVSGLAFGQATSPAGVWDFAYHVEDIDFNNKGTLTIAEKNGRKPDVENPLGRL
jgi:hypothetical protein